MPAGLTRCISSPQPFESTEDRGLTFGFGQWTEALPEVCPIEQPALARGDRFCIHQILWPRSKKFENDQVLRGTRPQGAARCELKKSGSFDDPLLKRQSGQRNIHGYTVWGCNEQHAIAARESRSIRDSPLIPGVEQEDPEGAARPPAEDSFVRSGADGPSAPGTRPDSAEPHLLLNQSGSSRGGRRENGVHTLEKLPDGLGDGDRFGFLSTDRLKFGACTSPGIYPAAN